MSPREQFKPVRKTPLGRDGGMNAGILIVRSRVTNALCVEKRIPPSVITSGFALREVRALQQCNHAHIIGLSGFDLSHSATGYGSIFMPYCDLGSVSALLSRLARRGATLPDSGFVWKALWDVSLALAYLQTGRDGMSVGRAAMGGSSVSRKEGWNRIFHRDIKPANLFLTWQDGLGANSSPYPSVVLGDFGCAVSERDMREAQSTIPFACDMAFVPPEAPRWSEMGDVYMLGLVGWCLAEGVGVPDARECEALARGVERKKGLERVVGMCLRLRPEERPRPEELPVRVWKAYEGWKAGRKDLGQALPEWAFKS
ncbi:kinase-like protein [Dothidotthia symphoricarpi CBS 119687]|uniref:non-specific serine/threonine protein kinase n=1 Tax=Dothidotthia symphoricarpi CBS 119687 TaxID=1392245 RepID=A0A6A6A1W6_9PLEO|nr:kinase-like protein [Dothidotthia symphoricarpi CBS 119687]KAF2125526.1 kinase-like protein [Dothidotthia symphoricarpi CBS 119687]